ncbi:antimicrobial peptides-like [Panicum hallii]|uniref:antimicrobial peptides-like n=1 Tax=Panicum hallii TaxID=206008 RepID=UPI000DF4DD75|nr:antimicrobial peptides-like [Panicum hallii]
MVIFLHGLLPGRAEKKGTGRGRGAPWPVPRWCRKGCRWQYGQDAQRRAECERECQERHRQGEREEDEDEDKDVLGSGRGECRRKCARRYEDQPWRVPKCVSRCRRRAVEEEEENEGGRGRECRERCHAGDWREKQRCLKESRCREHGDSNRCPCTC